MHLILAGQKKPNLAGLLSLALPKRAHLGLLHNLFLGIKGLLSGLPKANPQMEMFQLHGQIADMLLHLLQCVPSLNWGAQNQVEVIPDAA